MNDSCLCMWKSSVVAAGMADGESESCAATALKWCTDSTDYCPESPSLWSLAWQRHPWLWAIGSIPTKVPRNVPVIMDGEDLSVLFASFQNRPQEGR